MKKTKVYMLPLGCPKNMVNAEQMLHLLRRDGYEIVSSPFDADAAIVNTCGFIDSAKSEAIEAILELAELKKSGKLKALVVTGCLAQRYMDQFADELPEVDTVVGTGSYHEVCAAVSAALEGKKQHFCAPLECAPLEGKRQLLTPSYSAYLRIAEGCDNRCSYCIIPYLRGPYRSRRMEDIISEARELAANGARELIIVAQDITRYGTDIYGERKLADLLHELCKIESVRWIRLHYLYPEETDRELLELCAREEKILKYFDIPIQHISNKVLRAMNRRGDGDEIREKIDMIRALMPSAVIRTSLIVGFPGETEEDFSELCDFLSTYRLERAGVFCYSQEEGTPAAEFENQVDEAVKEKRREILYSIQERIMDEHSQKLVDKKLTVLCCGRDERGNIGRSYMDSPDIDGAVIFDGDAQEGDFVTVTVRSFDGCDLYATASEE